MSFRHYASLALLGVICLQSAAAEEVTKDKAGGFILGIFYFEQICRPSVGNPGAFHTLIERSDLRKLSAEDYATFKTENGLEVWKRTEGAVTVAVEYTRTMSCQVSMSHASEEDVRSHLQSVAKLEEQKGRRVALVKDQTVSTAGIPPYKVLQFHVYAPQGNFMLAAITSSEAYRGREAVFLTGPFR